MKQLPTTSNQPIISLILFFNINNPPIIYVISRGIAIAVAIISTSSSAPDGCISQRRRTVGIASPSDIHQVVATATALAALLRNRSSPRPTPTRALLHARDPRFHPYLPLYFCAHTARRARQDKAHKFRDDTLVHTRISAGEKTIPRVSPRINNTPRGGTADLTRDD